MLNFVYLCFLFLLQLYVFFEFLIYCLLKTIPNIGLNVVDSAKSCQVKENVKLVEERKFQVIEDFDQQSLGGYAC